MSSTEEVHSRADELDSLTTHELVALLLAEEAEAVARVARASKPIAAAADLVASCLGNGGRLVYVGAGTSGRLGVLDAAELPPTFGTRPRQVRALIAGGTRAIQHAVEGAEDRARDGQQAMARLRVSKKDVVCAIAASGATPFTRAALASARRRKAKTLFVTCSNVRVSADVVIRAPVGPEVIAGSTRLKAGTATKLILNAISTAAMVRLGKVYRGRMVDLVATNAKLRRRAQKMVEELGGVTPVQARRLLVRSGGSIKHALALISP